MTRLKQILGFMRPFKRPLSVALILTGVLTQRGCTGACTCDRWD